jgi:hypothetical protein
LGQKGRSLKHISDNRSLFENKTAEADLGGSFKVCTPENLVHGLEKLDLVHDTPFVRPAIKTQNDSGIATPTLTNLCKNNNYSSYSRPNLSLSTKRTLYSNKENIPEQIEEEVKTSETQKCSYSNTSTISCSQTVKENLNEIENHSLINQKDETCFISPETSRYNHDTSLYHSIRETTAIPSSSFLSMSTNQSANSKIDSSLLNKQLGCQPLEGKSNHVTLELSPAAKHNNFVVNVRSPVHPTTVEFVQDGEFKRPVNSSGNVCIKCASENFISVKGVNYSILNTLGHGGSSIVYEVKYMYLIIII